MVEIGKIERPALKDFTEKRKLYCVPNVYPLENASEEYRKLFNTYWDEVKQQIENLESIGKIRKIFYENIYMQGEEVLEILLKINERILRIIKPKIDEGAVFLPIETEEIFGSYIDWSNCLRVVRTKVVFDKVFEFYNESFNKRIEHIKNVIESNLLEREAGLLIIKDEDRVKLQFSQDMEIFLVTPPSYDSIIKWFRIKFKDMYQTEESEQGREKESETKS